MPRVRAKRPTPRVAARDHLLSVLQHPERTRRNEESPRAVSCVGSTSADSSSTTCRRRCRRPTPGRRPPCHGSRRATRRSETSRSAPVAARRIGTRACGRTSDRSGHPTGRTDRRCPCGLFPFGLRRQAHLRTVARASPAAVSDRVEPVDQHRGHGPLVSAPSGNVFRASPSMMIAFGSHRSPRGSPSTPRSPADRGAHASRSAPRPSVKLVEEGAVLAHRHGKPRDGDVLHAHFLAGSGSIASPSPPSAAGPPGTYTKSSPISSLV